MADPNRGELWSADLGAGQGREQSGRRPVLVLSVDTFNYGPAELVIVIPMTSKVSKSRHIPAHVPVNPPEGGLKAPSIIIYDQLRAISKDRLGPGSWGAVTDVTLAAVEDAVRILLVL